MSLVRNQYNSSTAVKEISILIILCIKNTFFVEILDHKTDGILSLLEDETKKRIPSVNDFMNRIIEKCSRKPAFTLPTLKRHDAKESLKNLFIIHHFAKNVCYSSVNLNRSSQKYNKDARINY